MKSARSNIVRMHELLYMAGKGIEKASKEKILKPYNLTVPRFIILHILNKHDEHKIELKELHHYLDVSSANMTGRIDVLERDGLVTRSQGSDRRSQAIALTDHGREVTTQIEIDYARALEEMFVDFDDADVHEGIAFLTKVLDRLGMDVPICKK